MRIRFSAVLLAASLLLCGCAHSLSMTQLTEKLEGPDGMPVGFWWYAGSDEKFHYLRSGDSPVSPTYRIRQDEMVVARQFRVTGNKNEWIPFHSVTDLAETERKEPIVIR